MSFDVSADAYDRFMGRYSVPLASKFIEFAGIGTDGRKLDVGCGPGALTAELVERFGSGSVSAVDPSESFVAAIGERFPGVDVRKAAAESLPFEDSIFGASLAQLVVHFMQDPVLGLSEMKRVTQPGGVVACCVWDLAGGRSGLFWETARELDPGLKDEAERPGTREGQLGKLMELAGLGEIKEGFLSVEVDHPSFEEWWGPYRRGVGPAGQYLAGLDSDTLARLERACAEKLSVAPFTVSAGAWVARGAV